MANDAVANGAPAWRSRPAIRRIGMQDVRLALRAGWDDFRASPTHLVLLCIIYPAMGLVLGRVASGAHALPMVWPLVAGFALVGPLAAVGLYEMSRQREQHRPTSWRTAFDVLRARNFAALLVVGLLLAALFVVWLRTALGVLHATMPGVADDAAGFVAAVLGTAAGWTLIAVGTAVGFGFALVVLVFFVISFPLLLDRDLGPTATEQVLAAFGLSARAVLANPAPMLGWGLLVAVLLAAGFATALVGLALVLPVLGHATWHLYRRLIC